MIIIKNENQIKNIRQVGKIISLCRESLYSFLKEGVSTFEIDLFVNNFLEKNGAKSGVKGFKNFPAYSCISVNHEIVHCIPNNYQLKNSDIVSVDIVASFDGYIADSCWTYPIGDIDEEKKNLIKGTQEALESSLKIIKEGIHLSDISNSIEMIAKKYNLTVIKEFAGHGVGINLHEDPVICNYGKKGKGPILKSGMIFAIEPIFSSGKGEVKYLSNNWNTETKDKRPAAHFEHTVLVLQNSCEILTL